MLSITNIHCFLVLRWFPQLYLSEASVLALTLQILPLSSHTKSPRERSHWKLSPKALTQEILPANYPPHRSTPPLHTPRKTHRLQRLPAMGVIVDLFAKAEAFTALAAL